MTFDEWKNTKEYQELIEIFGNFGYVEAIAKTAYDAADKINKTESKVLIDD